MKTLMDIYNLEKKLEDAGDLKNGYVMNRWALRSFKNKYDKKHKQKDYTNKLIKDDSKNNDKVMLEYECRKFYTIARCMSRYYNVK